MDTNHRTDTKIQSERAVLAAVRLPDSRFNPDDPFGELTALVEQAGATVVGTLDQNLQRPHAGTYMGSGKLDKLKSLCSELRADTVIFDHELSPKQIATIEKVVERKVLDRSEVILDIFASRATTHEAKLQVEIAQLEYTYPRLRAMWSHLERIAGGSPGGVGTRGPGEQQLEIDRRLVQRRKTLLKQELSKIQARKQRTVEKRNADHFSVGLVGYTNAGKSTLFNTLTAGGAYADDRLFATLMTRTRMWNLGQGTEVMLSDTVGFVRDLPHNLVASFRATLEEATHADLLLIVLDVSDPAAELQYQEVMRTLDELFDTVKAETERSAKQGSGNDNIEPRQPPKRVVLLNKVDQLRNNTELLIWQQRLENSLPICALPPEGDTPRRGQEELRRLVLDETLGEIRELTLTLPMRESHALNILETKADILDRTYEGNNVTIRARVGIRLLARMKSAGAQIRFDDPESPNRAGAPWKAPLP
ncbi:MAG TPA: GTPase HflX [Phycisphaerales bacterium]|nr:GTPase HflX [Phycisphaerales bacterium]